MAIYNLSGNFQPPTVNSGTQLPLPTSRAPSAKAAENDVKLTETTNVEAIRSNANTTPVVDNKAALQDSESKAVTQIEEFQNFNQSIDRSLQFKIDEELGVTIVRVVDKQTDELIRQFPPEELINLSKRLKELNEENSGNSGVLLQEKV